MANAVFDWDENKAAGNLAKHGVSFSQAITAFDDPFRLIRDDLEHSEQESRQLLLGMSDKGVLLVVFVEREAPTRTLTRIISARKANKREKQVYAKNR